MTDITEMQAQLDALRKARASGARKIEYDTYSVEYKSDSEMAAAIADLERRINTSSGQPVRHVHFLSSKGL